QLVVSEPSRRRDFYASVRAVDAAGNIAPVGSVAHTRAPGYVLAFTCTDALTGAPLAGIDATITTTAAAHYVTAADGGFVATGAGGGPANLAATRGTAGAYHSYAESFTVAGDVSRVIPMIAFAQPQSPLYASILALLKDGIFSPGGGHVIRRWHNYPV